MHKTGKVFMQANYNPAYDLNANYSDFHEFEQLDGLLESLYEGGLIGEKDLEQERRSSGLSTLHIRRKQGKEPKIITEKQRGRVRELFNRQDLHQRGGVLKVWQGGSLIECKVPQTWTNTVENRGGHRSEITGFSHASRLRLMRTIAKLDRTRKPLFITLTYPDEAYTYRLDGSTLKETHLKLFWQRLEYRYPGVSVIWRMEYETRKSGKFFGELFPHFHLLTWGLHVEDIEDLRKEIADMWHQVSGKLSEDHLRAGTRVERIKSIRGVFWYAAKYLAKEVVESELKVGRWWGVKGKENLPGVYCHIIDFLEKGHYKKVIDWMARKAGFPESENWQGLSIFCDAGDFFFNELDPLLFGDIEQRETE